MGAQAQLALTPSPAARERVGVRAVFSKTSIAKNNHIRVPLPSPGLSATLSRARERECIAQTYFDGTAAGTTAFAVVPTASTVERTTGRPLSLLIACEYK